MIKVAVCDDEKNIRTYLSSLIRKQNIECDITEYTSASDYLAQGQKSDLLFLDIEMKNNSSDMDGMSLAMKIRRMELEKQPIIIFVTGYEKYVYEAFDAGAFQYLLKPVNEKKFVEVFARATQQILLEKERQKKVQSLVVKYANISKAIPLNDIYYIESISHKVVLHMKDSELVYYAKMKDLEEELQGQFYCIHKGYLINFLYIDEYSKTEVTLDNGEKLLISKYKYQNFVKAYLQYMT